MINIDLGETYGLGSFGEALDAIEMLRKRSFSDDEINAILERSKGELQVPKRDTVKGVIIKGAKMPESCFACPCSHFKGSAKKDNYCQALTHIGIHLIDFVEGRPSFCPLIEVKGGNGNGTP